MDLYTQKTLGLSDGDRLFFPSIYQHVAFHAPRCNDGLIDVCLKSPDS